MIYRAIHLIQIFCAQERADERTKVIQEVLADLKTLTTVFITELAAGRSEPFVVRFYIQQMSSNFLARFEANTCQDFDNDNLSSKFGVKIKGGESGLDAVHKSQLLESRTLRTMQM